MDKDTLLDMIELINGERRLNEYQAFWSKDPADKVRLERAERQDAAAIAEIRRTLAPRHRAVTRARTSKRLFDAYLDNLLETCFVSSHNGFARDARDDSAASAPSPSHTTA